MLLECPAYDFGGALVLQSVEVPSALRLFSQRPPRVCSRLSHHSSSPRTSIFGLFCYTLRFRIHGDRMNHAKLKLLFVSTTLLASLAVFLFAASAQNPQQTTAHSTAASSSAPATTPKTASQQFKNIQILKDVPADELVPAMQFMTASLGVDCEYCHVEHAFDKDDKKPKQFCPSHDGDDVQHQ